MVRCVLSISSYFRNFNLKKIWDYNIIITFYFFFIPLLQFSHESNPLLTFKLMASFSLMAATYIHIYLYYIYVYVYVCVFVCNLFILHNVTYMCAFSADHFVLITSWCVIPWGRLSPTLSIPWLSLVLSLQLRPLELFLPPTLVCLLVSSLSRWGLGSHVGETLFG